MSKPHDFLSAEQRDGSELQAKEIYEETWKWLKQIGCAAKVSPQLLERYAMCSARWIQCEEMTNRMGFLSKHPTTQKPIPSPFINIGIFLLNERRFNIMAQSGLSQAKNAKNDEFYTQYEDIEKEMNAYYEYNNDVFRDKTILLPCDDPEWSNFTKYFSANFERFGIKKLISTSYVKGYSNTQLTFFETSSEKYSEEMHNTHGKVFILERDTNHSGKIDFNDIEFEYLLDGETKPQLLDIRVFEDSTKRSVYQQQTSDARKRGVSNCPLCAIGHDGNAKKIWDIKSMDADHVSAWSTGGTTDISNCQMLCITHNRAKGNR